MDLVWIEKQIGRKIYPPLMKEFEICLFMKIVAKDVKFQMVLTSLNLKL
jgi:hypothetical protein